jgi:iron(III) transport system substrate-binding protein
MSRLFLRPRLTALILAVLVLGAGGVLVFAAGGSGDALIVYNGRSHYGGEEAFERFTKATGIEVELFAGSATELYERLRNEGAQTPADVLVTVDGANLSQAKEAGLLQRSTSPAIERNVPADLRDPDGQWVAISTRLRTLVRSTERVPEDAIATYEDLGDARWKGRVCLRTSNNVYNQSFVAAMLAERGERDTEELLRSWMANEPQILGSDVDVLKAIAAGKCDVGLTNHYYLARELKADPNFPVAPVWADQDGRGVHANISGAAVVKGTDKPAQAARLVEFLTTEAAQADIAANGEFPVNDAVPPAPHISSWTGFKTDPMDVAAAGEKQPRAVELMSEVGWE